MRKIILLAVTAAGITFASGGASEAEFKAAMAAAEAANKEAAALKNQWTPTAQALADARKAATATDYGKALALARQAEALARASINQAREQEDAWKATAAIIR